MTPKPILSARLRCDACGAGPLRKPAIDIALGVLCARCAPLYGMSPGEYGTARSYEQWQRLAADRQEATNA